LAPKINICLSPDLYPRYADGDAIVVVVDVFRATSAIATALYHGVKAVRPIAGLENFERFPRHEQRVWAAERGGQCVDGFDLGNSPLDMIAKSSFLKGKELVLSTTNGTQAIESARKNSGLITGAYVNISAVVDFLVQRNESVLFICAGWKGRVNLEDSLFCGDASRRLLQHGFELDLDADAVLMCMQIAEIAEANRMEYLRQSSHRIRLKNLELEEDVVYCLTEDIAPVVPIFEKDGRLLPV
jgi:2-phosphosulfolactate phosphatase